MAAFWLLSLALVFGKPSKSEMKQFNEVVDKINQKEDLNSIEITDENYSEVLYTNQDKFVIFCHPQSSKCKSQLAEWSFFGKKKDTFSRSILLGKVDISKQVKVASLFGVKEGPTILYITQDHFYNYTGRSEPKALVKAVEMSLYLQHDRKVLPPKPTTFRYYIFYLYKLARKIFLEYTVIVTGVIAALIYFLKFSSTKVKQD